MICFQVTLIRTIGLGGKVFPGSLVSNPISVSGKGRKGRTNLRHLPYSYRNHDTLKGDPSPKRDQVVSYTGRVHSRRFFEVTQSLFTLLLHLVCFFFRDQLLRPQDLHSCRRRGKLFIPFISGVLDKETSCTPLNHPFLTFFTTKRRVRMKRKRTK